MLATTCFPFLFQAIDINGKLYWDGGIVGSLPIVPITQFYEDMDIVVVSLRRQQTAEIPKTQYAIWERYKEAQNRCSRQRLAWICRPLQEPVKRLS